MEDFNSETDSDYTSYWRDWDADIKAKYPPPYGLLQARKLHAMSTSDVPDLPATFLRNGVYLLNRNSVTPNQNYAGSISAPDPGYQFAPGPAISLPARAIRERDKMARDYLVYFFDTFISSRGNEYFCEIDEEYLTDRFNLTGLNTEVQYYQYALDLVTDVFDLDCDDDMREQIEKSARHLYGLVHARYIVTTRGLARMLEKYKKCDFGKCPRVMCDHHPLLPMGLSDLPNQKSVKLYCAKCEDLYNPKSSRHASIDGAYFGSSFHNILFQVYPALIPEKSRRRYEPKIYGFKVHASAALARWQDVKREEMKTRLKKLGIPPGFEEEVEEDGADELDDDDDDEELEGGEMVVEK